MTFHDVRFQAASEVHRLASPNCPRCGEVTLLPEAAEFAGSNRVRHTWLCEGCGTAFRTMIRLTRELADTP